MATEEVQPTSIEPEIAEANDTTEPVPALPDYLASPDAVFGDEGVQWRYGRPPDYTKTRKVWAEGKTMNHAAGSLPQLVENLVKNWEVEASFKPRLSDWRTIDHANYSFAMGGGPPQSAEHMIKVGTYNGIIAPNEYYSPENSDFNSSHKTFKRMMPTFAWEVLEVYSGPPKVSFRWRHWGVMKNDYVGFNNKGEKVTAKAHGGLIDIQGVTVAEVDEKIRMRAIQTWMDPLEMFRQIAPYGVVRKEDMNRKVDPEAALDDTDSGVEVAAAQNNEAERREELPARMPDSAELHEEALPVTVPGSFPIVDDIEANLSQTGDTVTAPITSDENVDVLEPSESIQELVQGLEGKEPEEISLLEACAIIEAAATQAVDLKVEKPDSTAPEVTQFLPPASIPTSVSNHEAEAPIGNVPRSIYSSSVTGDVEDVLLSAERGEIKDESKAAGVCDAVDDYLAQPADVIHPAGHEVLPVGNALAAGPRSEETRIAHEEMSSMSAFECPFLQNRE